MSSKKRYKQAYIRQRKNSRKRRGTKKQTWKRCALFISGVALFILLVCTVISFFTEGGTRQTANDTKILPNIEIQKKLLKKNEYSRPGIKLREVDGVVVHYTANPGTDALANRNYFNNLPKANRTRTNPVYASSHFVVGLKGQIVQCIPLDEMAYASNDRNTDTIAVECCHLDKTGKFNQATYGALVDLLVYLCVRFDLDVDDVIRHYDVTGKACPRYYVENEDEWEKLKETVQQEIDKQ